MAQTELVCNTIDVPIFDLCNNAVCFDIGANEGGYIDTMLQLSAKKIYAFEAGHKLSNKLREKYKDQDKVEIIEGALSDEKTILKEVTWINSWMIGKPSEHNLPISPGACDIEGYDLVDIRTHTLDDYVKENSIEQVDFIKIDVDGYEYKVLKGGINTLTKNRPVMFCELSFYIDAIQNSSVKEFIKFIDDLNYKFVTLSGYVCTPEVVLREFPWHTSCDIILIPQEKLYLVNKYILGNIL